MQTKPNDITPPTMRSWSASLRFGGWAERERKSRWVALEAQEASLFVRLVSDHNVLLAEAWNNAQSVDE
jgi:hypothetical protein